MQHLPVERLAELADGEPSAAEREHLLECTMCATERAAYQRIVAMAADERRRIAPPLTDWGSLRGALQAQGVIVTPDAAGDRRLRSRRFVRLAGRVAAAALVLSVGLIGGRMTTGMSFRTAALPGSSPSSAERVASSVEFTSSAAALASLQRAQLEYERAAIYLASHDTSTSEAATDLLRTRLAALDEMAETSLRALGNAPADPIMNQFYLTTLGARNMTLGRLATVLPVGSRLSRF